MLIVLEGLNDVQFLVCLSRMLARCDPRIPDLEQLEMRGRLVLLPSGGGPRPWTSRLRGLGCREMHIFDRESGRETEIRLQAAEEVNRRPGCAARITRGRAAENYLHTQAILEAGGPLLSFTGNDCVPTLLAAGWHVQEPSRGPWRALDKRTRLKKVQRAKSWLNHRAVLHMTRELLRESDEHGDIESWLLTIGDMLRCSEADAPPSTCRNDLCPRAL